MVSNEDTSDSELQNNNLSNFYFIMYMNLQSSYVKTQLNFVDTVYFGPNGLCKDLV